LSEVFERGKKVIPGGVSSPARAFLAVGGDPVVAARGDGAFIYDPDGNRFIDYIQGFGSVILGHAHPRVTEAVKAAAGRGGATGLASLAEVELAERIVERVASIERVRFVTSGTEASMTAARIARAATQRDVILKFEGCYHGHADAFLAKAGSGVATFAVPMAVGVPAASVADTVVVPYDDVPALEKVFAEREVAAVFVEPVAANMGVIAPDEGFLQALCDVASANGSLVVFDEVVTGFRVGPHGAQGTLRPDLTMFGKVVGGGLPIGVVGGRADLMDLLAPVGPVYQAGTYAAHPHAMAAGAAVLDALQPTDYATLEGNAVRLFEGLVMAAREIGVEASVVRASTFGCVFFAPEPPRDFSGSNATDKEAFARFHRTLRQRGVLIAPSPFEAWFPSLAHTEVEIDETIDAARDAFAAAKG
jgi:glutamate-1-semialdehyde 2,1-aminomutase